MAYDILIRNGRLIDGSGSPGVVGDLAVADGRITAIGPHLDDTATRTIDASGLAVAPGFIDIKTHSDFTLPINPRAESKVRQGVTTEIIGHCGFSVAPVLPGKAELLRDYLSPSAPWLPFRETTFESDIAAFREMERTLWRLSEKVSGRLKAKELAGATVTLKLKTADFRLRTRARSLAAPTQLAAKIFAAGRELLER